MNLFFCLLFRDATPSLFMPPCGKMLRASFLCHLFTILAGRRGSQCLDALLSSAIRFR